MPGRIFLALPAKDITPVPVFGQHDFWYPASAQAGAEHGLPDGFLAYRILIEIFLVGFDFIGPVLNQLSAFRITAFVLVPGMARAKTNEAAVALDRLGRLKGGKARAAKMTKAERSESAKKAAQARWQAHEKPPPSKS